jgi:hypothetical protein
MKSIIIEFTLSDKLIVPNNITNEEIIKIAEKKILNKICWLKKLDGTIKIYNEDETNNTNEL